MNETDFEMLSEYDFSEAQQGPLRASVVETTTITLPIETELLDWFRQKIDTDGGGNFAQLVNQILRDYMVSQINDSPLILPEKRLRQILREELQSTPPLT